MIKLRDFHKKKIQVLAKKWIFSESTSLGALNKTLMLFLVI